MGNFRLPVIVLGLLVTALAPAAEPLAVVAPEVRLEPGKSQTLTFNVPEALLGQKPSLAFLARLDSPTLGGSTFSLQVIVNGKTLEGDRLLNKPLDTEMLSGLRLDWYGGLGWRVVYSPDYEACNRDDHPACLVGGHAYDFVLDLAGVLRAGANEIVFKHSETRINNLLLVKDLTLVETPARVLSLEPPPDPDAPLPVIAPRPVGPVDYQLRVLPHGGLQLRWGKSRITLRSSFSYPNVGWNTLGPQRQEAEEPQWQPLWDTKATGDTLRLQAQGKYYRLQRTITRRPDHLAVADRLTNLTRTDLHIGLKHALLTSGLAQSEVYVHGLRSRIGQSYDTGGDNPTVLVRTGPDSVGLVAEDDVFRAQSFQSATTDPAEAFLGDNYFMLGPGASYEVRWSVYPVPAGGYYDFVNAVRRNWGTNFTIPGPFTFPPHPTVEKAQTPDLKSWVAHGGLQIVSLQIPMPEPAVLSHGLAFLRETAEQQRLADQARRLREAAPGLQVLQYLHTYITRLDEAVQTYSDARHLGADGKQLSYAAGAWKPTFWLFLPTTTNAYGREMNKTFDLVVDHLGFDGVYWDEMAYSARDIAYQLSDGHTCLPDLKTRTVQQRVAFTPLYCQAYQAQQARRLLGAGKILIANGQPVTETMTKLRFPRFVEAWNAGSLRKAHLYSPLGLSSPDKVKSEADIVPSIRSHIENGGLWYYYCGWHRVQLTRPSAAAHLFPFTPVELQAGYLIGRERILAARSGIYGWGDQSPRRVTVYDAEGLEVKDFPAPLRVLEGKHYTELRLPPGGLGIIERL
jgi:hypothetical protein